MKQRQTTLLSRRHFLGSAAALAFATSSSAAFARNYPGGVLPWTANSANPPTIVRPGPWQFFTFDEAAAVEAIVDRLVPQDDLGPGGKQAGCAVYIDRQLAGAFGDYRTRYMGAPFMAGTPSQGNQSATLPKESYRSALAGLDAYCKTTFAGKGFAALAAADQDKVLSSLEKGEAKIEGADSKTFFELLLQNTMEGFFADPIYGGNQDMAGWKLVGFPGARYDYRDHVTKHNQPYPFPPVSILGRPDWTIRG